MNEAPSLEDLSSASLDDLQALLDAVPSEEWEPLLQEYEHAPELSTPWLSTPVQEAAYYSLADEVFFGGSAGSGKTDLAIGLSINEHQRSAIFRREGTELVAIVERMVGILGHRNGYNGQDKIWRLPENQIVEFGSVPHAGDERKYQGRPHDLLVFDEICHFLRTQYLFLCGWNRHEDPYQRCRILCTGNPPTTPEGFWVKKHWGPWLDPNHKDKAEACELRWYAMVDGESVERPDGTPFKHGAEVIVPRSRTFIPGRIDDNPFLSRTSYKATLQALPEPLRSQMLLGDFQAGSEDNAWQVIPTEWVKAAMDRWENLLDKGMMTSMGCDPARGGGDSFEIARRHGSWYDEMKSTPGKDVPDGQTGAGLCIQHVRNNAPMMVDVIGVGSSVVDHLAGMNANVDGIQSAGKAWRGDKTGLIKFHNLRAMMYWSLREELDPTNTDQVALPPDDDLLTELTAARYSVKQQGLLVEDKADIIKRIGRSTDKADAVVYASHRTDGAPENRGRTTQASSAGKWTSFGGDIDYSTLDKSVV